MTESKVPKKGMTWFYLLAIPLVLAIFLVQDGMLLRTLSLQSSLSKAATTLDRVDSISSLLDQASAAAERTSAGTANLYAAAASRLYDALQELQDATRTDPAAHAKYQKLEQLVTAQTNNWQEGISSRTKGRPGADPDKKWTPEINQTISDIRGGQEAYLGRETDAAMGSLRETVNLFKFGGAFVLWIVVAVTTVMFYSPRTGVSTDVTEQKPGGKESSSRNLLVN